MRRFPHLALFHRPCATALRTAFLGNLAVAKRREARTAPGKRSDRHFAHGTSTGCEVGSKGSELRNYTSIHRERLLPREKLYPPQWVRAGRKYTRGSAG